MRMGSASPVAERRVTSQQGPAETEWGRLRRPWRHSWARAPLDAVMRQAPTSRCPESYRADPSPGFSS
ncbi:hypothetical protein GCM10010372_62310 [Streptomyces tauricus]|nr:hypothetical protein GCM10010372_62310 [Streptomyces tauricus]